MNDKILIIGANGLVGNALYKVFKDSGYVVSGADKICCGDIEYVDITDKVSVEKLLKHFERYKPYQQLAVHYIWEDLWWKRKNKNIPWLEKLIRI